jgi:hypothetical protein
MTTNRLPGAAALAALLCAALPAVAASPSKEITACYGVCNHTVADKAKRSRCFQDCRAEAKDTQVEVLEGNQGRASGTKDRLAAERGVAAEEKKLSASAAKGKPGPLAERTRALTAYNRALAILRAAGKIQSGRAGYLGETNFREQKLRELQATCEAQFQRGKGESFVYDPLSLMAQQIIKEYNDSLKAPRYGGESF